MKKMKSVTEIVQKYYDEYGDNFGLEIIRDKTFPKQVEIKNFWGKLNIYEEISRDLRLEGYTVFG
jgi:hypothetical protein